MIGGYFLAIFLVLISVNTRWLFMSEDENT